MSSKRTGRRGHPRFELIDLPDEPAGRPDTPPETETGHDSGPTKRQLRSKRLRFAGAAVAAVAALVVAWQLIPDTPPNHNADKPIPHAPVRPPAGSSHRTTRTEPSNSASIRASNQPETDAMPLGATSAGCKLTGLRDAYPDAEAVATGIRSAVVDHLDHRDRHVESFGQVNCTWPDGTDQRELEVLLTWTSGSYKGLITIYVANFKDPLMTGCGTGWSCTPASHRRAHARSARVTRDTGDRGFGVVVERNDGQYVSILAGAMPQTNNDIDPTRSLNHFPFAAKKLLAVAVDPRVHLDPMITPPH